MGGGVGEFRSWEEDIYWTHFQFIHFTQFLRSDFHQQLALPKTFSDNVKKKLPENVTVKGPGGVVWNVGLTSRDNTLYFTHGWQQFVKDQSLKEKDFLVFKYNGESLFEVLIFDGESFCEKAASYFVRKCGRAIATNTEQGGGCSSKERDTNISVEEVHTPPNGVDEGVSPEKSLHHNSVQVPFAVPSETPNGKTSTGGVESASPEQCMAVPSETPNGKTSNGGVESASPEQCMADAVTVAEPAPASTQTYGKRARRPVYPVTPVSNKRKGPGRPTKASNSDEKALNWVADAEPSPSKGRSGATELYTSNRRLVTQNEIDNTLKLAQAACTDECLVVVMRPSHVYKRFFVSLPIKWISNHLSPFSQDVILRTGKNEWLGKYMYDNIRNSGGLAGGGWKLFALDNNLEEFDVCLFKPAGLLHKLLILDISIYRVVEKITPLTAVKSPTKRRAVNSSTKRGLKKTTNDIVQTELEESIE